MKQTPRTPPDRNGRDIPRSRGAGWRSVERQLPLLMAAVLAVTVASGLAVTYATLAQSARERAAARLRIAAERLAQEAQSGLGAAATRMEAVARNPSVRAVLAEAARGQGAVAPGFDTDLESAQAALARLLPRSDTTLTVELWTADGRRVTHVGRDALINDASAATPEHPGFTSPPRGLEGLEAQDSVRTGRMFGADSLVYFWTVAPVKEGERTTGYILRQARLTSTSRVGELLRALSGSDVRAYYHNIDDDFWTTVGADVVSPPARRAESGEDVIANRADVGDVLLVEERIGSTPLVLALELPLEGVLAAPRASIARLALLSAALTLLGALAAWLISRRFTRPLAALTEAAEAIAAGRYEARVQPAQDEELARLATSFNRMAEQVGSAQRELAAQSAAAMRAHAEADAASRAKSQFLAVMSHELRTPLNAIGGYTELMELGLRGPLTDEQRRDLARIRASQEHLLGLISGVLDLSRIESGRVAYQVSPILLDPFLAGVEALVEPQAAAKALELDHDAGDPTLAVMADHEKLRQILLNLLSNAIRFTPRGGRIALSAEPIGDSMVAIEVRDTGIGIAADAIDQIFEPFVQLDRSLTNVREGIGLGLSISRDLARGMGGDLRAESRVGEGSCFTLTLPRAVVEPGSEAPLFSGEFPAPANQST